MYYVFMSRFRVVLGPGYNLKITQYFLSGDPTLVIPKSPIKHGDYEKFQLISHKKSFYTLSLLRREEKQTNTLVFPIYNNYKIACLRQSMK